MEGCLQKKWLVADLMQKLTKKMRNGSEISCSENQYCNCFDFQRKVTDFIVAHWPLEFHENIIGYSSIIMGYNYNFRF